MTDKQTDTSTDAPADDATDAPDETPADKPKTGNWYYESGRHLEDLERELAGRLVRKAELVAMNAHQDALDGIESEIEAVRANLARYGRGQKAADKRPAAAKQETRVLKNASATVNGVDVSDHLATDEKE